MQLRRVRAEEVPTRRYLTVFKLWVPYHRELGEITGTDRLADTFEFADELA